MEKRVKELLSKVLGEECNYSGTDMFEDGIIDSLEMMALITEIEVAFGVEIDGEDIIPDNFRSIDTIFRLIRKYILDEKGNFDNA